MILIDDNGRKFKVLEGQLDCEYDGELHYSIVVPGEERDYRIGLELIAGSEGAK